MTNPPRILVDATAIPSNLGGVGRYLEHLIPALATNRSLQLIVVAQQRDTDWIQQSAPHAQVITLAPRFAGRAARLVWEQFGLPRLARRVHADIIHSPHYTMPLATRVPVVVTFHDATFFSHPEVHTWMKRAFFRIWTRVSSKRAASCVVPSIATGDELTQFVGLSRHLISVAYHGVDPHRFRVPTLLERAAVAVELGLPETGWISFLGTVEPRKNVANLVRAYARLATDGPIPPLVIAGAPGWDQETGDVVAALPPSVDVRLVGYVDADTLPALLGGSTVFVYPSLGEGFGLPVLEAMACGAPTLTTRKLALPEVGGDAVWYTGTSVEEIAESLGALLADARAREALAHAGPARSTQFSWARSAAAHADAYMRALNS